jgi:hypothetical protein
MLNVCASPYPTCFTHTIMLPNLWGLYFSKHKKEPATWRVFIKYLQTLEVIQNSFNLSLGKVKENRNKIQSQDFHCRMITYTNNLPQKPKPCTQIQIVHTYEKARMPFNGFKHIIHGLFSNEFINLRSMFYDYLDNSVIIYKSISCFQWPSLHLGLKFSINLQMHSNRPQLVHTMLK